MLGSSACLQNFAPKFPEMTVLVVTPTLDLGVRGEEAYCTCNTGMPAQLCDFQAIFEPACNDYLGGLW